MAPHEGLRVNPALLLVICSILLSGCFPVTEVEMVPANQFTGLYTADTPTKAVLHDGTIMIFPNGCMVRKDTLAGMGRVYGLTSVDTSFVWRAAALSDLAAVTWYDHHVPGARVAGSVLLAATGATLLPQSIRCLECPKCCFGSCPTVYTYNDSTAVLEAELFSSSVSPLYEQWDLDRIGTNLATGGVLNMRITNEALETHYINTYEIVAVTHPKGTRCYPAGTKGFCVTHNEVPPERAVTKSGQDVLFYVKAHDEEHYRTGDSNFKELVAMNEFDWIDVSIQVPHNATRGAMVLRMKNSLLSTVLFYDMVLGSQGIDALEWTQRIAEDKEYAQMFRSVYETFSGIAVKVRKDGSWQPLESYTDVGPISWKESALELPVEPGEELTLRLQFFPDNFLIDNIAFSFEETSGPAVTETVLTPQSVIDNSGEPCPDVLALMANDDDLYLETNPGDAYRLTYRLLKPGEMETTLFIRSKGYYTEWIRGNWVRAESGDYRFNLYDIPGTLAELSRRWQTDRQLLEQTFFESRIPVREENK